MFSALAALVAAAATIHAVAAELIPIRVAYIHNSLPVGGVETHVLTLWYDKSD